MDILHNGACHFIPVFRGNNADVKGHGICSLAAICMLIHIQEMTVEIGLQLFKHFGIVRLLFLLA